MSEFKRIKELGLEVLKRYEPKEGSGMFYHDVFYVRADDLERLLENAVVKPIEKDTAESLLREILASYEKSPWAYRNDDLIERARKLFGAK